MRRKDLMVSSVMHPTYLPFSADVLSTHFAPVAGASPESDARRLDYYLKSIRARELHEEGVRSGVVADKRATRAGRQMEKDERFWVAAALMALFYDSAGPADSFARLLQKAGVAAPPGFSDWAAALAGKLHLYFEANLPSPAGYQTWLRSRLDTRVPVPHLHEEALRAARLEGTTKVDALLLSEDTKCAVLFEAKVLSDISTHVTFDVARNQFARNIDVMLESRHPSAILGSRRPELTSLVLLTPAMFRDDQALRQSRLYGWLYDAYRSPESSLLREHLGHRESAELASVPARLGWATWEDCTAVSPRACPWLRSSADGV